jgi:hypothetical protein
MTNPADFPKILPLREQARIVDEIVKIRFETILPMVMRETGFDMWISISNEDNYDPVFKTFMPWEAWAPILQIIVFFDRGEGKGVERYNISRTDSEGLMTDIFDPATRDQWGDLKRIVTECNPKRIGINTSSTIWAADGLTKTLHDKLAATLGPELSSRFVSAEPLCIRWLETRTQQEIDLYEQACAIAHAIMKHCFSRDVITPGVTTTDDIRWHYWQTTSDLGLPVSFPPFIHLYRSNANKKLRGEADQVIRPGDMVHCDVGFHYLRLVTDHQELAYILKPGETDAPPGLQNGIMLTNQLQDIFTSCWAQGRTGNEILAMALTKAKEAGIPGAKIYSHSLSFFLHEPGPLMGLPWEQVNTGGRGDVRMNYDTCYTVELSVTCPVPEWDGQEQRFPLEQDACFRRDGVHFIDGRQTRLHLV